MKNVSVYGTGGMPIGVLCMVQDTYRCSLYSTGYIHDITCVLCMVQDTYMCSVYGTGYLQVFCSTLMEEFDRIPGDSRTQIGFIAYDSSLYFFGLNDDTSQPQVLVVSDLDGKGLQLAFILLYLRLCFVVSFIPSQRSMCWSLNDCYVLPIG